MFNTIKRFHKYHGTNVVLCEEGTVACRSQSYANALVFSEFPLKPNDLFLLEIDETERGWSGDMRIGLTTLNPQEAQSNSMPLPQYALPDLSSMRHSWIYAISKSRIFNKRRRPYHSRELFQSTSHGELPIKFFLPTPNYNVEQCATDVGSQIGLVYVPTSPFMAELHFIVNGIDQGAFASDIPHSTVPLYVVIDVYGCTKKVRVVQLYFNVPSLQELCRDAILQHITKNAVSSLPLPNTLKKYLLGCNNLNVGPNISVLESSESSLR